MMAGVSAIRQMFQVQTREIDEGARQLLISTAKMGNQQIVADQTARAGIAPRVKQFANSPGNTAIESVRLPGPIVFLYDYRAEIAKVTLDALRRASPVVSGAYRDAHLILLNGTQVDALPAQLADTDRIVIVNPVPYARRIEIGKTESGRAFVLQVPNRIYERTAKSILAKYRGVADVQFGYQALQGSYSVKGKLTGSYVSKGGKRRRRRARKGRVDAPAIFILPPQAGRPV